MSLFDALRTSLRTSELVRARGAYATRDPSLVGAVQLQLLNDEWARVTRESPWFSRLKRERGLPGAFLSLGEFAARVPVTRAPLENGALRAIPCLTRPPELYRTSGRLAAHDLPAWESELAYARADRLFARDRYGVAPGDGVFVLDAPERRPRHGPRAALRAFERGLHDRVLGARRFTLRSLDAESLARSARALVAAGAKVIAGRGDVLDAFARANVARRDDLCALGARLVVASPKQPADPDRLRDLFGCPVATEYAAVEDDPIAHTLPDRDAPVVFWRSWLVEADPTDAPEGSARLVVTSLYPRCFPMVRCDVGDVIARPSADDGASGLLELVAH